MARCTVIEYHGRQCTGQTYMNGNTCIWHKVLQEFRADINRFGGGRGGEVEIWISAYGFAWGIQLINLFSGSLNWLLLMPIVIIIGGSLKYFADGTMAINGPISNFVVWAKALAAGMMIELAGCLAMGIYIVSNPTGAEPLIRPFTQNEWWLRNSGWILAVILFIDIYLTLQLLTRRVLFREIIFQDFVLYAIFLTLVGGALRPYIQKLSPIKLDYSNPQDWAPALGAGSSTVPLWIAWVAGFILCELINAPMRSRRLTQDEFKNTVTSSYVACAVPPTLGILAGRYLLPALGITGPVPFVIIASMLALFLGWLATNWLINSEIAKRYHSPWG